VFDVLLARRISPTVCRTIVLKFGLDEIREAEVKRPRDIWGYLNRYKSKKYITEEEAYKLYCELDKRNLEDPAIMDILWLYPGKTVWKVLNIMPRLTDIMFVCEIQKHEKKESVKEINEEFARHVRQAVRIEQGKREGAKIEVVQADPELEAEADDYCPF